jgi:TetR/AcrR family transcriptional repressor of nem operon
MARTKEFDREQALDRAMHVFWDKGYEATSLADLLTAMGIARQSLYDTFGDKRALYLEALRRYEAGRGGAIRACFAQAPSVRRAFRELFDAMVDESAEQKRRGCLGVSTIVELSAHDPEIAALAAQTQRGLEKVFYDALERARASGEIPATKDARALARFFVGALQGLRVASTADPSAALARDIARVALEALD